MLGAEVLSSGEGFVKSLETQNVQLFQLDEIAEMFGEMGDANHYMAKTGKLLKQAYSSSGDQNGNPIVAPTRKTTSWCVSRFRLSTGQRHRSFSIPVLA